MTKHQAMKEFEPVLLTKINYLLSSVIERITLYVKDEHHAINIYTFMQNHVIYIAINSHFYQTSINVDRSLRIVCLFL